MDTFYSHLDFTVAIPTFNGASRQLLQLILSLQKQEKTEHISCEIIVVDNNSTDGTAGLIAELQQNWNHRFPLIYVTEQQQGTAYARQTAMQLARGEFVGFLDDDNIPNANWLAEAYWFGRTHSRAGAWGGRNDGVYEIPLRPEFSTLTNYMAIQNRGPKAFICSKYVLPPGAGLVVRRLAWLEHVSPIPILPGRIPEFYVNGEDVQSCNQLQHAGWEIWYNPSMVIDHYMPAARLSVSGMLSLMRSIGLGRYPIRWVRENKWQRVPRMLAYFVKDIFCFFKHLWQHRHDMKTNLLAQCYLKLYQGILLSPWAFLKWRIRQRFIRPNSAK